MTFWQGKKVLITGHTGFKGGWLALWLQHLGAEVVGIALPPATHPNLFTLAKVATGMQSTFADVRNLNAVKQAFIHHQPEIVFHLAAQSLVRYSYHNPVETYATNIMGTVHVLEGARAVKSVRAIVNVTTDKCYESQEWCWGYRENDRLGGHDPYSNSKACAELVTTAYRDSYLREAGIGLATVRAGNVIGGGDWAANRLIPDIIHACMEKRNVSIRNPRAMRPWQHVLDPLRGYMLLAKALYNEPGKYAESWNFGPNDDDVRPVSWIADFVTKHWGGVSQWSQDEGLHPHETHCLKLDCSKAKAQLHWHPRYHLPEALHKTINWYRAYLQDQNMHDYSMQQIKDFIHEKQQQERENNVSAEIY